MPEPENDGDYSFAGAAEDYPEEWLEFGSGGTVRLRSNRRPYAAQDLNVDADGTAGTAGRRAWFLPGKFRFCPACGDQPAVQAREINKLASLSAEGRSSATTLLVSSALRWMNTGRVRDSQPILIETSNLAAVVFCLHGRSHLLGVERPLTQPG